MRFKWVTPDTLNSPLLSFLQAPRGDTSLKWVNRSWTLARSRGENVFSFQEGCQTGHKATYATLWKLVWEWRLYRTGQRDGIPQSSWCLVPAFPCSSFFCSMHRRIKFISGLFPLLSVEVLLPKGRRILLIFLKQYMYYYILI